MVVHVRNLSTGEIRNLRLAAKNAAFSGNWLVFEVPETAQGEDLNGDGDTEDEVIHVYNVSMEATTNLRLAGRLFRTVPLLSNASGDWLEFIVSERAQSEDLNRDGDLRDFVVHLIDLRRLDELRLSFTRGDANADGNQNLTDAVFVLDHLFGGGKEPPCAKSADADDSGTVDLTDPVFLLNALFSGGPPPPAPFPECGPDPTDDNLTCLSFEGCQ